MLPLFVIVMLDMIVQTFFMRYKYAVNHKYWRVHLDSDTDRF